MNDNDIASKLKATIRILFTFGQITVLIICIWPNSQDPITQYSPIKQSLYIL